MFTGVTAPEMVLHIVRRALWYMWQMLRHIVPGLLCSTSDEPAVLLPPTIASAPFHRYYLLFACCPSFVSRSSIEMPGSVRPSPAQKLFPVNWSRFPACTDSVVPENNIPSECQNSLPLTADTPMHSVPVHRSNMHHMFLRLFTRFPLLNTLIILIHWRVHSAWMEYLHTTLQKPLIQPHKKLPIEHSCPWVLQPLS